MLQSALFALWDASHLYLRHQVEKRGALEKLDLLLLYLDEMVDDGRVFLFGSPAFPKLPTRTPSTACC